MFSQEQLLALTQQKRKSGNKGTQRDARRIITSKDTQIHPSFRIYTRLYVTATVIVLTFLLTLCRLFNSPKA